MRGLAEPGKDWDRHKGFICFMKLPATSFFLGGKIKLYAKTYIKRVIFKCFFLIIVHLVHGLGW